MTNLLRQHFPLIRDRNDILQEIGSRRDLKILFESWEEKYQNEFIDFCTGVRGVKLLYDSFFKAVMNPEIHPERLEEFLSELLEEKVKILMVLPNDSTRIAAENSLLVLDVVVQLADGSIANIEVQKIGYSFPGQRSACYSADLLLRQYKRVKGEKGKAFSYKDIKKVYTIVLFEKSVGEFHKFPDQYIHHMSQTSDTGIKIDLLQEYIFIALDIFTERLHNEGVNRNNKLEAWLTFLSVDNPEMIIEMLGAYPEFEGLYKEVYELCRNVENIMGLFSEELAILDKNTVDYMIDEMQNTIDGQKSRLAEQESRIAEQESRIAEQESRIAEQESRIAEQESRIAEQKTRIAEQEARIAVQEKTIIEQKKVIDGFGDKIDEQQLRQDKLEGELIKLKSILEKN